jgi:hypothetical protein
MAFSSSSSITTPSKAMETLREAISSWTSTATPTDILTALASLALTWYALSSLRAWYRLRHIPGPFLASFSYLWGAIHVRRGRMQRTLYDTQRRYGPLARIGPNEVLVYDPETLWHINGVRSTYTRGGWYQSLRMDPSGESILSEPDTARHDARKAVVTAPYAGRGRQVNLEAAVDSQLAVLVDLIQSKYAYDPSESSSSSSSGTGTAKANRVLDFGRIIHDYTIDIVTLVVLGKPWGNVPNETDTFEFVGMMDAFMPFVQLVALVPFLRSLFSSDFFLRWLGPKPTDKRGAGQFLGLVYFAFPRFPPFPLSPLSP